MSPSLCLVVVVAGVLAPTVAVGQSAPAPTRVSQDLEYLAADARAGRRIGSVGADSAAQYIAGRFAGLGLEQASTLRGWYQPFQVAAGAPAAHGTDIGGTTGRNVVAMIRGRDPDLASEFVVVGAHYDHLGLGGPGSLDPDSTGVIHNGADDNASGVTALLEIARLLAVRPPARSVLLVAFSGEEYGLLGSAHFLKEPVVPVEKIAAMLNLDMVGRLREDKLVVYGVETATELRAIVDSANRRAGLMLNARGDGYGPSDHMSFTLAQRPVLHFFTGTHEDYHRTTDDSPRINLDGIVRVAALAADVTRAIGDRGAPLTFVALPPPARAAGEARTSGYGAYLGTVPDMTDNPGGVRLSGVRAGSPAEQAGMVAGDIILRIGDHAVPDLQAMTDALRAHLPGDVVDVVFRRGNTERTIKVTLGRRGG